MKYYLQCLRFFIEDHIILRFFPKLLCEKVYLLPDAPTDVEWAFMAISDIINNSKYSDRQIIEKIQEYMENYDPLAY